MQTISVHLDGLEEIQTQIKLLASKIDAIQNQKSISKWLSNAEASEFLGVTARTLQNYRDNGTLSYSKIGSKIYYKLSDLEDLLNSNYCPSFSSERRAS